MTLRGKLTYANVMATVAVFLALGGGAYAATQLPKNSVGAKQLKPHAVTPAKLSALAKKAMTGPAGPQGPAGAAGAAGATKVVVRTSTFEQGRAVANCLPGEVATGGGGYLEEKQKGAFLWDSTPVQSKGEVPTAWEADAADIANLQAYVKAFVICASP
jgi:hypothetical protein